MSYVTNGTVNTKVDKTYYNGSYSLSGQWTVWNGNRNINTIRLDRLSEEQAELSTKETANSIQERIAQIYSQILYLDENVKVNEQMLETSMKNEERGKEMVEVGKMSKADLAQLSAQRANDQYSIVESKSQLMNYKLQLKQLLEITDEEQFDVAIPEVAGKGGMDAEREPDGRRDHFYKFAERYRLGLADEEQRQLVSGSRRDCAHLRRPLYEDLCQQGEDKPTAGSTGSVGPAEDALLRHTAVLAECLDESGEVSGRKEQRGECPPEL